MPNFNDSSDKSNYLNKAFKVKMPGMKSKFGDDFSAKMRDEFSDVFGQYDDLTGDDSKTKTGYSVPSTDYSIPKVDYTKSSFDYKVPDFMSSKSSYDYTVPSYDRYNGLSTNKAVNMYGSDELKSDKYQKENVYADSKDILNKYDTGNSYLSGDLYKGYNTEINENLKNSVPGYETTDYLDTKDYLSPSLPDYSSYGKEESEPAECKDEENIYEDDEAIDYQLKDTKYLKKTGIYDDEDIDIDYDETPAYEEKETKYVEPPAYEEEDDYTETPEYMDEEEECYDETPEYEEKDTYVEPPTYGETPAYEEEDTYVEPPTYGETPAYEEEETYVEPPAYKEEEEEDEDEYVETPEYMDEEEEYTEPETPSYKEEDTYVEPPTYGETSKYDEEDAYVEPTTYEEEEEDDEYEPMETGAGE